MWRRRRLGSAELAVRTRWKARSPTRVATQPPPTLPRNRPIMVSMHLSDVLRLGCLEGASVIAGRVGLQRDVRWVHVIDNPDAVTWARPGQFLLTTGYAWPRDHAERLALFEQFAVTGVTAVGLAVPQFFERFPDGLDAVAERHDMTLIEIPWEMPFAQITQEVHTALLSEQTRVIERSEAIHRALTRAAASATNLDAVVRTLTNETGRSTLVISDEYTVLAYAGPPDGRPTEAELLAFAPSRPGAQALDTDSVAEVVHATEPLRDVTWAVRCPVRVQGVSSVEVLMLGSDRGPGPLELRAVEHGALVAALHLAHHRELASVETRLRRSFIDDLVQGRVDKSDHASERGHVVGFSMRGVYRVALAELDVPTPLGPDAFRRRENTLTRVRTMLVRYGATDLVTTTSNRVIVLLPEDLPPERLWEALGADRRAMVVSRSHQGVDGVRSGYREADASIGHVPNGTFASFEALLLPRALTGDTDAQRALVESFEAPLAAERGGDKLATTAFTLARHDFVLTATAATLRVHISTLRHRLERIEDVLGVDVRDADTRFRLRIATFFRDNNRDRPT
ncbi:MAG: PucR family transcriptional regulator [Trueperaceae bacterium]|nr:MAG: PucR family transcriptional regulator [Trueperaceae bacterium]